MSVKGAQERNCSLERPLHPIHTAISDMPELCQKWRGRDLQLFFF